MGYDLNNSIILMLKFLILITYMSSFVANIHEVFWSKLNTRTYHPKNSCREKARNQRGREGDTEEGRKQGRERK